MHKLFVILFLILGLTRLEAEKPTGIFGNDWVFRKDIPVLSSVKNTKLSAYIYQKNTKLRLVFYTPEKTKKVNTVLMFDPKYFFVKGTPVLVDTLTKEQSNIDYTFKDDRLRFKVDVTNKPKYIEMDVISRKLGNQGALTTEDKLKQARTIRRISPQTNSWSPLAKNQIIAQTTLRPIICYGGYDINSEKIAIIWGNDKKLTGRFEIINALNNRQFPATQPVVYTGKLKETGFHIWGGNNYIADFSDFKKEGLYLVRVMINETDEVTDSYVFPIKKGLYIDLSQKAAKWFYYQRCGTEVPGFHELCHTKDAVIKTNGDTVDITGGWHDAGDYGKWIYSGASGVLALTTLQDAFGKDIKNEQTEASTSPISGLTEEALWEAEYFCKAYWDSAFHEGFTPDFDDVCTWLGAPETESPRIIHETDMLQNIYGIYKSPGISLVGASMARTARQILSYNKELPERYKRTAEKCVYIAKELYEIDSHRDIKANPNSYLGIQTGLLMTALELYEITGDKKYQEGAEANAKNILKLQDKDGIFYSDEARTSGKNEMCSFYLVALYEFFRRNPENNLNPQIKTAFKLWADYNMQFVNVSNFGLIGNKEKDGTVRNIRYRANSQIGAFVWGMSTAALLLKEHKYLTTAENNLRWIIGFNSADISMMAGIGKNPGCYHHRYCFMKGCEDGIVPGGILNGIVPGNGKLLDLGDTDTRNFVAGEFPVDYPIMDTGVWGWTYSWMTSEYWIPNNSWFILGAIQLQKALASMQTK
ncbi:MAG: glycoside hydrolase family 9 protein [bacterium]